MCTTRSVAVAKVFNKALRVKHLNRSAKAKDLHLYNYLKDLVTKDLGDRLDDLTYKKKRVILALGSCSGLLAKNLSAERVETLVECDISSESLSYSQASNPMSKASFPIHYIHADEEYVPVRDNVFDTVLSCLHLHWVNDLLGNFKQVHKTLRDDSPFIGSLFGGDTLFELRSSLQLAETERLSTFSLHCAPKTTGQDIGRLLQSSGFKLITVDITDIRIRYPSIFELMFDLQGMGESNASINGSKHLHRDVLLAAAAIYQQLYGSEKLEEGVPATFQVINFIGWKNPTKATPLRSG